MKKYYDCTIRMYKNDYLIAQREKDICSSEYGMNENYIINSWNELDDFIKKRPYFTPFACTERKKGLEIALNYVKNPVVPRIIQQWKISELKNFRIEITYEEYIPSMRQLMNLSVDDFIEYIEYRKKEVLK